MMNSERGQKDYGSEAEAHARKAEELRREAEGMRGEEGEIAEETAALFETMAAAARKDAVKQAKERDDAKATEILKMIQEDALTEVPPPIGKAEAERMDDDAKAAEDRTAEIGKMIDDEVAKQRIEDMIDEELDRDGKAA